MISKCTSLIFGALVCCLPPVVLAQGLSLYSSVSQEAREVSGASLAQPLSPEAWKATLAERREKWLEMLGLSPLPKRTPLQATVTGVLERGDYVVEESMNSAPCLALGAISS